MTVAQIQPESALRSCEPGCRLGPPLMPVRGAMSLLDLSEKSLLDAIEDGRVFWVFNVAMDPAVSWRKELRILPQSAADFQTGVASRLTFEDVINLLVPGNDMLIAPDIQRALNVTESHVYRLFLQGRMKACTSWRRGPGGSARVARSQFVQFLKARRYPFPEISGQPREAGSRLVTA